MGIQTDRIRKDIEELAKFNSTPELGLTRFSYTEEHRQAEEYVIGEMKKAGLRVRKDAVGNVFGRREGAKKNLPPLVIGSHIDSVQNGGIFDGMAGIAVGLEVVRALNEEEVETLHPVEVVSIVEEEGGRFSSGLFGSRAMAGLVQEKDLHVFKDAAGVSLAKAMKDFSLDPAGLGEAVIEQGGIEAFLELHIEQGPVLEKEGAELGVVDSIVGITAYEVEITGRPDHAGTTPMEMRYDALRAASEIVRNLPGFAAEYGDGTVATVGRMEVSPGAVNIVPGDVKFTFECRSKNFDSVQGVVERVHTLLDEVCGGDGYGYSVRRLVEMEPTRLSGEIVDALYSTGQKLGISCRKMHSGAGHDSMFMTGITKVGMLFVPSRKGRSHCPDEWSDYEAIARGAKVFLSMVRAYGRS